MSFGPALSSGVVSLVLVSTPVPISITNGHKRHCNEIPLMSCTCSSFIFFLWKIHWAQTDLAWFRCGNVVPLWSLLSTFECSGVLTLTNKLKYSPASFLYQTALVESRPSRLQEPCCKNCLETLQFQFHAILVTQSSKSCCLGWSRFATRTAKWPMVDVANQISEALTTRASCAMVAWAKPTLAPKKTWNKLGFSIHQLSTRQRMIVGLPGPGHLSS